MEINQEMEKGAVILNLKGRLDGVTRQELQDKILNLIQEGQVKIVIDFTNLDYISSAGLRVLLLGQKKAKATNGLIVLSAMKESIKEVFDISGFSSLFSVYTAKAEALENLS